MTEIPQKTIKWTKYPLKPKKKKKTEIPPKPKKWPKYT